VAYDTRPHDWSIRSNSEAKNSVKGKNFAKFCGKKPSFEEKLSFKCLVLCKSYQLVVYVTSNHIKRIMMERENVFELTDIIFIDAYYIHLFNPQNKG
jgi:hypothetical protein